MKPMHRRRGYILLDITVSLGLLAAVAMVVLTARSGIARLDAAQADRRAAVRAAEAYLAAPPATRPEGVTVTPLPTTAPAGWQWVRVEARAHGRRGELVGLVRRTP